MKTKAFLLLCLFIGTGLIQLSAQDVANPTPPDNRNQTGNEVFWWEWPEYFLPVLASTGEEIDMLVGSVTCHYIRHYHDGIWVTERVRFSGEIVSVGNDEHFQINDH